MFALFVRYKEGHLGKCVILGNPDTTPLHIKRRICLTAPQVLITPTSKPMIVIRGELLKTAPKSRSKSASQCASGHSESLSSSANYGKISQIKRPFARQTISFVCAPSRSDQNCCHPSRNDGRGCQRVFNCSRLVTPVITTSNPASSSLTKHDLFI